MKKKLVSKLPILIAVVFIGLWLQSSYKCTKLREEDARLHSSINSLLKDNAKAGKYNTNDIFKSVSHIDVDADLFEEIYRNDDEDISYYRYIGKRDLVKIGDTVTTDEGIKTKVLDVTLAGFEVKANYGFYAGKSGTSIFDKDKNIVGYVSTIYDDKVYCIWR